MSVSDLIVSGLVERMKSEVVSSGVTNLGGILEVVSRVLHPFVDDMLSRGGGSGSGSGSGGGSKAVSKGKAKREVKEKEDEDANLTSWSRIRISKKYGLKSMFPEMYLEVKGEMPDKTSSMKIVGEMQNRLMSEPGQKRFVEWYKSVQGAIPKYAPSDPPSPSGGGTVKKVVSKKVDEKKVEVDKEVKVEKEVKVDKESDDDL